MSRVLAQPLVGLVIAVVVGGCESQGEDSDPLAALINGEVQAIDLTHSLSADMSYWPGPAGNPFRHDTLRAHPSGSPAMAAYYTPEHHGTHIDAPVHFGDGLPSVDELTTVDLFGPLVVLDVRAQVESDPDYGVSRADIEAWEEQFGPIPEGAVVVAYTGWAQYWEAPERYASVDSEGTLHFPGFGPDAARFLVEERSIRGIGIDTPSVDPGAADGFPVHEIVNGNGYYQLENLADLNAVPETGAVLLVAPVKIEGGSGGQVRVWALVPPVV